MEERRAHNGKVIFETVISVNGSSALGKDRRKNKWDLSSYIYMVSLYSPDAYTIKLLHLAVVKL